MPIILGAALSFLITSTLGLGMTGAIITGIIIGVIVGTIAGSLD